MGRKTSGMVRGRGGGTPRVPPLVHHAALGASICRVWSISSWLSSLRIATSRGLSASGICRSGATVRRPWVSVALATLRWSASSNLAPLQHVAQHRRVGLRPIAAAVGGQAHARRARVLSDLRPDYGRHATHKTTGCIGNVGDADGNLRSVGVGPVGGLDCRGTPGFHVAPPLQAISGRSVPRGGCGKRQTFGSRAIFRSAGARLAQNTSGQPPIGALQAVSERWNAKCLKMIEKVTIDA